MNYMCSQDVVWSPIDHGALLVRPADGSAWSLNATAALLWKVCAKAASRAQLVACAARVTGWREERAKREVEKFIGALDAWALIRNTTQVQHGLAIETLALFAAVGAESPAVIHLKLGHGPRVRPSPRGNSGPG